MKLKKDTKTKKDSKLENGPTAEIEDIKNDIENTRITLKEIVSQLFICKNPDNLNDIKRFISEGIGGFMIGKGGEISSKKQGTLEGDDKRSLKKFVNILKKEFEKKKKTPPFLAIDGEGGDYFNRLKNFSDYRSQRHYGIKYEDSKHPEKFKREFAQEVAKFAELMNEIGINMNFAPLVDCAKPGYRGYVAKERVVLKKRGNLTASESFASNRSYSDNMDTVIALGITAMKIFQKHKIIPTLKHFPSYGLLDVRQNPHSVLPHIKNSKKEIMEHILPYKIASKKGAWAIMKGHAIYDAVDKKNPASLSEKMDNLLRKKIGFSGLSVVDELNMGAIKRFTQQDIKKAAEKSILVNDIILISHPETFIPMRDAILKKAGLDEAFREKVIRSYLNIISHKKKISLVTGSKSKRQR